MGENNSLKLEFIGREIKTIESKQIKMENDMDKLKEKLNINQRDLSLQKNEIESVKETQKALTTLFATMQLTLTSIDKRTMLIEESKKGWRGVIDSFLAPTAVGIIIVIAGFMFQS